jgi:hypothetical protein
MTAKRRRLLFGTGTLLAGLLAALALLLWGLPALILDRVQARAHDLGGGHHGRVERVSISLLPPGYRLHGVQVQQGERGGDETLLRTGESAVRLHPLSRRAEVRVLGLMLNLDADSAAPQLGAGVDWRACLDALAPESAVVSVEMPDVHLRLRLSGLKRSPVDVDRLRVTLTGLERQPSTQQPAPARISASGRLLGHAALQLEGVFDPEQQMQRLNVQLRVEAIELARLDSFARHWGGIDFERGQAEAELRLSSRATRVRGRLTLHLQDVDVFSASEDLGRDRDGVLRATRELLAAGGAMLAADRGGFDLERSVDEPLDLPADNFAGLLEVLVQGLTALPPH